MNTSSPINPGYVEGDSFKQPVAKTTTPFYRLTTEEWLTISQDLKYAELRLLYYLKTLDPFGDRQLDLKVVELAEVTGLKKGTISKALRVLADKGYIDLKLVRVKISVKKFPVRNQVSCEKPEFPVRNQVSCEKPRSTVGNFQEPETIQEADSRSPHTIHTDQTNQTLSQTDDLEREKVEVSEEELLKFTIYKIKQSPEIKQPRAYAKRCLRDDRDFWIDELVKWQESRINVPPPAPQIDSNSVIAGIDGELARLGWNRDQAIAHMECFGWRKIAFDHIVDDDLLELLNELEQMESEVDV